MNKLVKPSYEELEVALKRITALAHFGGLADLDALDALSAIRFVTLKDHFDEFSGKSCEEIKAFIKGGAE